MTKVATIRPLRADDIDSVAHIFMRQFRNSPQEANADLTAYIEKLFLSGPFASSATPSLVHVRPDGVVSGFIGVTSQPMQIGDQRLNVAVCGALMVEGREADPLAGARLMKTFLSGEQDISLSETAGEATLSMWRQSGGDLLSRHSVDWMRVIRPAGFAIEAVAQRIGVVRALFPATHIVDRQLRKTRSERKSLRWASFPEGFQIARGVSAEAVTIERFLAEVRHYTDAFPIRRVWTDDALTQLAADIPLKSEQGELRTALVHTRTGTCLGGYAYYHRDGKVAHVLDILPRTGHAGVIVDCLLQDASEMGAVAVQGRTNPAIFDALLERRCFMFRQSASVIAGRDKDLIERFKQGDAAFNGLVGERWSRLVGDGFA